MKRRFSRRSLLRRSAAFPAAAMAAGATVPRRGSGPDVYTRLGVRPFINCCATWTMYGGSRMLPEVIRAMEQAAHYHVWLDELQEAAGRRIAELLGAPAAMVANGAGGAVTLGTVACIAGGDPEKMQPLPDTSRLKNEVVVPRWSRNVYDHLVRCAGARLVEAGTLEELERAFGPRTAMAHAQINILHGGNPFTLEQFVAAAHRRGVPVQIDAADRVPVVPNPYLSRGADLVCYSGGKILRGPQSAGILMGRKDLVTAAYAALSPSTVTFGRALKVSKEQIVGMAAAVEALFSGRDRAAEDAEWTGWLRHIGARINQVPGVNAGLVEADRSFYPVLNVRWDLERVGITGDELFHQLMNGEPRIATHAQGTVNSFPLRPAAMYPGEHEAVAERLYAVFNAHRGPRREPAPKPPARDLTGRWSFDIEFAASATRHHVYLNADGHRLTGMYSSWLIEHGDVKGTIDGDLVEITTTGHYESMPLIYVFRGKLEGDTMSGEIDMGWQYGPARWKAVRA
ncbi:MAG: aminotransferase class V-fold PLP-dependent enzyme [Bryobacterales bacterium]|nr:aminotransferase class V-fold PLP-dependent enzyme [Bryobacterales bacterium]